MTTPTSSPSGDRDERDAAFQTQLDELLTIGESHTRTLRGLLTRLTELEQTVVRLTGEVRDAQQRIAALEAGRDGTGLR